MRRANCGWLVAVFLIALCWRPAVPTRAAAVPQPIEVIQSAAQRVMEILNSTQPSASAAEKHKRRDELVKIVHEFVDFQEMAQRVLARHWRTQPEEKRQAFVPLFEKLLYNTYIDKVDNYSSGSEKAVFDAQVLDGSFALVRGRIVGLPNRDIAMEYRLKLQDGQWRAFDVVIEGVSFVGNYRSQFNAIVVKDGFDALLEQMRQKISELESRNP